MKTWIVIPCYNEAKRLEEVSVASVVAAPDVNVVLVDDGSTDNTWSRLQEIESRHVELLRMARNVGKAEAVRLGMGQALRLGAEVTGYADADFATPPREVVRLVDTVQEKGANVVLGSRWLHLGAEIRRSAFRHYTGRVFATFASMLLRMPVYDTQCGAKVFRVTDNLRAALDEPFLSRWAFDVELIGRLRKGMAGREGYPLSAFVEVPLEEWADMRGSKMGPLDMVRATFELFVISRALRRTSHTGAK